MMNIKLLTSMALVICNALSFAQSPNCSNGNQFIYGLGNAPGGGGRTVFLLTKSGSSITYNGVFTSSSVLVGYSLAIADLGDGNKFYTHNNTGEIIKYTGSSWQTVYTTTDTYFNSAGKGNYLYYHSTRLNDFSQNRISRFNGTTLTTLWEDQSVYSPVADIAVDDNGNVYFFTGATAYDVNTLNILSPTGIMLQQIPLAFEGFTGYGACFLDNKLCVFFTGSNSMYPNQMLPITITGNSATLGTGVSIPQPVVGTSSSGQILLAMIDLASCSSAAVPLANSDFEFENGIEVYVNSTSSELNIKSKYNGNVAVFNSIGQKITTFTVLQDVENTIAISSYAKGMYLLNFDIDQKHIVKKIMKL